MEVEIGSYVEVYLNGSGEPLRQKLALKQRTLYTFPGITENINILRFDPTDLSGAEVSIYSLDVEDDDGVLRRFGPVDLRSWASSNLKSPEVVNGAFHFFAANNDPIILSRVNIALRHAGSASWASLLTKLSTADFLPPLIAISFVLYVFASLFSPTRCFHLPLAWAALLALEWVVPAIVRSDHKLARANVSVGQATFFGRSLAANQLGMFLTFTIAVVLAVMSWLLIKFLREIEPWRTWLNGADGNEPIPSAGWAQRLINGTMISLLGGIFSPNLRDIVKLRASFLPHWDSNNFTYWSYLAHRGFLPYRDFWYAYAGFYVFELPFPTGTILRWLYMWLLFSIFFVAFYRLSAYRLSGALLATAVLLVGTHSVLFGNSQRYLLAVDLVLSYLVVDTTRPRGTRGAIWFWLSCALALFFEPIQLVYAGAAIGVKIALDLWQYKPCVWGAWRTRILWEFTVPLGTGLLVFIWLGVRGQLAPFLQFQFRLPDLGTYSAMPTNLVEGLKNPLGLNFLALAMGPPLIAVGLFERLRSQGIRSTYADAILGLGLTGYLVSQKHIIRDMGPDVLTICVAGLLAYVMLWRGRRSWLEYLCGSMIAGGFLFFMIHAGSAKDVLEALKTSPHSVADSFHVMRYESPLLEAANAAAFAPERFELFPDELKAHEWIRQNSGGNAAEVFALTDDPILYILTGQEPVYQSNLYSTSPLYEQRRLVSWLTATDPQYVTLDPAMMAFDQVPSVVRCPLVFAPVIEAYVPEQVVGRIEILRRRASGEFIPLPYWRDKLGATLNLGHLARVSSFSRFAPCKAQSGSGCVEFLRVRFMKEHPEARTVSVPIEAEGFPFTVEFETVPSQDTYYVFLDRVWFWKTVKDYGGSLTILKSKAADGLELQMISRADLQDVLY